MIIEAALHCNTGRIRSNNEDNFYFNGLYLEKDNNALPEPKITKTDSFNTPLFCVFDGMGGEEAGEVASHVAAKTTALYISDKNNGFNSSCSAMEKWCFHLNNTVFEESKSIAWGKIGTTMVSLYFDNKTVTVANIGDSPAFRIRGNEMVQLSKDHVEMLPPSMKKHKPRLTQNIGVDPTELMIEPFAEKHTVLKNDVFLLCSDGLTDMVENDRIVQIIKSHASLKQAVIELVNEALKNGGRDNITVTLIRAR